MRLPALRERREDIPELVSHFLARFAAERRLPALSISEEAMAALQAHDWPGNIRQLRNIIERTIILAPGDRVSCIDVDLLPPEILDNQNAMGGSSTAMAIMGSPLARSARNRSNASISRSRSGAFQATSRAPRRSSAWNARRCTGSSRLWASGTRGKGTSRRTRPHMAARSLSLQDHFLNSVRRAKLPVTIFLVKGVKLQGVITWFDSFSLLLRREGASQLVYKHSISTIMPSEPPPDFVATKAGSGWREGGAAGPVPRRSDSRHGAHDLVPRRTA